MPCLSDFELYSRWVPLRNSDKIYFRLYMIVDAARAVWKAPNIFLARENIRFSTLFAAGYVSRKTSKRRRARRNGCFSQATIFCENK